jgi:hypothetical protein
VKSEDQVEHPNQSTNDGYKVKYLFNHRVELGEEIEDDGNYQYKGEKEVNIHMRNFF